MDILSSVYIHAVALSALAVVLLHQVLKFKFIPWKFANQHPVPTLILLSIFTAVIVNWRTAVHPQAWTDWAILVGTTAVTAAITYISTIKNWAELRATEGY